MAGTTSRETISDLEKNVINLLCTCKSHKLIDISADMLWVCSSLTYTRIGACYSLAFVAGSFEQLQADQQRGCSLDVATASHHRQFWYLSAAFH